ncbi:helix-turn-helix domain-containing protein [Frateuria edaphi]|uniref:helix-turn-helix domain-containing protein n=1 Tax=Frateuria edaphi TaxID=2898793 RepID=UPI001E3B813F|nr:helix-turn-helix domain-containing protein [Frateuria edaphi]UGB46967.1 helix-turn-helix domain-containing protein [Frateuria edaphi]
MNSIASMAAKTPTSTPSKEALALAAAMARAQVNNVSVARHMSVSDGMVSQWVTGRRPVPAEKAARLGAYLDVDPRSISAKFNAMASSEAMGNVVPLRAGQAEGDEPLRHDLVIRRLENDVDSLRYALSALVSVMTVHRPAEASDVAKTIRKHVPARYVQQGFVQELLQALDKGGG